jgi:hypothetical protein
VGGELLGPTVKTYTYLMDTRTLSSLPWSVLFNHTSSISADTSAGSTFWASTRTSSGSTRLTSISLAGNGLLLRGVPGVLGRGTSKLLALWTGEPGTGFNGFDLERSRCVRDSDERVALNFLMEDRVEERGRSECCDADDRGRLGVNGIDLGGLGVDAGAIVVSWL